MLSSEYLAVGAAICMAFSSMLISELNGRVSLFRLARWQITAAFMITAALATFVSGWGSLGTWQFGMLVGSGFFGIVLASTTYFAAIQMAGPRVTALLFSLTAPLSLFFGYVFLGESINAIQASGVFLIVVGILVAIGVRRRRAAPMIPLADKEPVGSMEPATPPISLIGVSLGVTTAVGQAVGSLLARPVMASGVEPFTAMAVRSGFAALCFLIVLALPVFRKNDMRIKIADAGLVIASAFVGTALGMSLLMAALASGDVGIVSTLSSMTPVVILPMIWIRSGVMPRAHAWGGAATAIVGIALIRIA